MKKLYKTLAIVGAGAVSIGAIWYYVFSPKRVIKNNTDSNIKEIDVVKVLDNGQAQVHIIYNNGAIPLDSVIDGNTLSSAKALGVKVVYLPA